MSHYRAQPLHVQLEGDPRLSPMQMLTVPRLQRFRRYRHPIPLRVLLSSRAEHALRWWVFTSRVSSQTRKVASPPFNLGLWSLQGDRVRLQCTACLDPQFAKFKCDDYAVH